MTTKEKIDAIFSNQYMEDVINSVKCMLRNQMTKRQLREMIFYMVEGEYPYIDCSDMRPTKVSDKLQDALLSIQEEILFTEEKFIDALRHVFTHTYSEQKTLLGLTFRTDLDLMHEVIDHLQHLRYEWLYSFLNDEELREFIISEILLAMIDEEGCMTLYMEYSDLKEKNYEKK